MVMDITYKITFYDYWHCGSGLSAGADVDLLVIKDKNKLPFVPGKTMKGLVREALNDILHFQGKKLDLLNLLFGKENAKKNGNKTETITEQGCLFFKNAELEDKIREEIVASQTADYLYEAISSTAIEANGVAKDQSLRRMEVTVPCELYGEILDVPEANKEDIECALKYIKRLGQNRNRGLGRCDISIVETKKGGQS